MKFNSKTNEMIFDYDIYRIIFKMTKKERGWVFYPTNFRVTIPLDNNVDITDRVDIRFCDNEFDIDYLSCIVKSLKRLPLSEKIKRIIYPPPKPIVKYKFNFPWKVVNYLKDSIGLKLEHTWERGEWLSHAGRNVFYLEGTDVKIIIYPLSHTKCDSKNSLRLKKALKYNTKYLITFNTNDIYVIPITEIEKLSEGDTLNFDFYKNHFDQLFNERKL